jgi:hypothetical protein
MKRLGCRLSCLLGVSAVAFGVLTAGAGPAAAAGEPQTCSGTSDSPGVLAGTYSSNVVVSGFCAVNAGPAVVNGNLTVRPNSALVAAFGLNDQTGTGSSSLTVNGNLKVESGSALILGCTPVSFGCFDDPNQNNPTLSSPGSVSGNLDASQPLAVIVHNSVIGGNVSEAGGGGGLSCDPSGVFSDFGIPPYSDYEDSSIGGSLGVTGLTSCWLGMARDQVSGNMNVVNNQLLDPDAIEILSNQIGGNLLCQQNSNVWDSFDLSDTGLYPRQPAPNTVNGNRVGQCVLASPATEGGPPGPGPF